MFGAIINSDMNRAIIHVDMDAFFASVEIRERPELAGRPVVVGGSAERRGVVAAASYEARRFGIHSAMPMASAQRLCPALIILPPRHGLYAEVSEQIHAIFERYTPQIEPISLDEAFLDVTASERLFGAAESIGRNIQAEIRVETGLVASVGVAPNKFLAKLASDLDKPNGFRVVAAGEAENFLEHLPVERLWGVGKVTARVFERLGIRTIGQLRHYSPALLQQHLGNSAAHFLQLAQGRDERPVVSDSEARSISHETTFAVDMTDRQQLLAWLHELTEQVGQRLRRKGLSGRTVQIKVRYSDFTTITRAVTLPEPTHTSAVLWRAVQGLFEHKVEPLRDAVRLIGVGVSGFDSVSPQQSLPFEQAELSRQRHLDSLVDAISGRFGKQAVTRGHQPEK